MTVPAKPEKTDVAKPADVGGGGLLPDELRLPIIGIVQEKNHLLDQGEYEIGMIVDLGTGEIVSKKNPSGIFGVEFIPVHFRRVWVCKNARTSDEKMFDKNYEPGALIFKTENPVDPRIAEEDALAKQRECQSRVKKYIQFLCYVDGMEMPAIVSFGKSSYVPGEQLLNALVFAKEGRDVDFWQRKYRLTSVLSTWKEHHFYKLNAVKSGDPTEEELALAKKYAETIAKINYQPSIEDYEEEDLVESEAKPASSSKDVPY